MSVLSPAVLDAMLAAGCTAEQIVAAVKAASMEAEEVAAERRERDRLRKREQRAASKNAALSTLASGVSIGRTGTDRDSADAPPPSPDKKAPQTPKELTPSAPAFPAHTRGDDFDQFWSLFPNKVGKADAVKAFGKARQRTDFETLMAGLRRYVAKTDDRPWCNPSTWLNQDRWTDEPARPPSRGSPPMRMDDFLGTVIEQQERRNAGPDTEIEGAPQALRAIPGGRWSG